MAPIHWRIGMLEMSRSRSVFVEAEALPKLAQLGLFPPKSGELGASDGAGIELLVLKILHPRNFGTPGRIRTRVDRKLESLA